MGLLGVKEVVTLLYKEAPSSDLERLNNSGSQGARSSLGWIWMDLLHSRATFADTSSLADCQDDG